MFFLIGGSHEIMARIFSGILFFNYFSYVGKKQICGHSMKQRIWRVVTVETSFPIIILPSTCLAPKWSNLSGKWNGSAAYALRPLGVSWHLRRLMTSPSIPVTSYPLGCHCLVKLNLSSIKAASKNKQRASWITNGAWGGFEFAEYLLKSLCTLWHAIQ